MVQPFPTGDVLHEGEGALVTEALPPHPAKYSAALYPLFREILDGYTVVLDPMCGLNQLAVELPRPKWAVTGVEIEPTWAAASPFTICRDATKLSQLFPPNTFDACVVSPAYGNRMADHHKAKDASKRITYTHTLRTFLDDPDYELAENSTCNLPLHTQGYYGLHAAAWAGSVDALRSGGLFVLNTKNFYIGDDIQHVADLHLGILVGELGLDFEVHHEVPTPGMKFGANRDKRVENEDVYVLRKPVR